MAKDIPTIDRQIGTPNVPIAPSTVFAQLGEVTQKIGSLAAAKLGDIAIQQYGLAGQLDALEGSAPKNLGLPVNEATTAYNKGVILTEAQSMALKGQGMITEAYQRASDQSKFNPQTPAEFKSQATGIIEGVLENTRPEARVFVANQMQEAMVKAQSKMLGQAIDYDNKQRENQFNLDKDAAVKIYNQTLLTGTKEEQAAAFETISSLGNAYSQIDQRIAMVWPQELKKIQDQSKITLVLADYIQASDNGKGDEFISNFAIRDQPNLTQEEKINALGKLMSLRNEVESAINLTRAVDKQTLTNDIHNPSSPNYVQSQEDLESRTIYKQLSPLQQQQVLSDFVSTQSARIKEEAKIAEAFKEIGLGRAGAVDKSIINNMFNRARASMEQATGEPLTLAQQFEIVKGLQTNVPEFDKLMASKLTGMDPISTNEASMVYATAALKDQTPLMNLTGDAKVIAERMTTVINGQSVPGATNVDATKNIINQVLKTTDTDIVQRTNAANTAWKKNGPAYYKAVFGRSPNSLIDNGAFEVFGEAFKNAMIKSSTEEEAARIAKDSMRAWGTDPFFEKDEVAKFPPNKELPLSAGTWAIHNQIIVGFNSIAKRYNAQIKPDDKEETRTPYKFTNELSIPENPTQASFIERPLIYPSIFSLGDEAGQIPYIDTPVEVEANGVKSTLKLKSGPFTNTDPQGGLIYGLMAADKFGEYKQLEDPRNEDGLAYIRLKDLDKLLPALYAEGGDERLVEAMQNSLLKQRTAVLESELSKIMPSSTIANLLGVNSLSTKIASKLQAGIEGAPNVTPEEVKAQIEKSKVKSEGQDE